MSSVLVDLDDLTPVGEDVLVRSMLIIGDAIGLWLGDISRTKAPRTHKTYSRTLDKFEASLPYHWDVAKIGPDECRRFLDLYRGHAANTCAGIESTLNTFFEWLRLNDKIKRNPMDKIPRTRRPRPETLDVVTVSSADVRALLAGARTWTEKLSVAIPAYLGARRHATAQLRVRDWDPERQRLRFREKGGKTIWKPVPGRLGELIEASLVARSGEGCDPRRGARSERATVGSSPASQTPSPDDYLIPVETGGDRAFRDKEERDDRVVWNAVGRVAKRTGVRAHTHSLRAAFACFYLEQNPGDLEALQPLLGHRSLATTQTYLRRFEMESAMERVRELSWT